MDKKNIFWILITVVIAVILLIIVINLVFKSDTVNEGKFRVSDVILTSSAELTNKTEKNGVWSIDLSQRNKLSMLVTAATGVEINKVYLSDITVNKGNVIFSQLDNESKITLDSTGKDLDVEYTLDENNQMLLEFVALNENILKDWVVPETTKQIVYDGRMVTTAGLELKDIQFKLKFKLNIVESTGKTNTMKVELLLPNEELVTNGADVRRLSLSEFKFKVN
ncbi:MAG: hypothetical protein IJ272_06215 [Clostridia bacterium]|nr:hypothetical protein [Clostridia bacterium]